MIPNSTTTVIAIVLVMSTLIFGGLISWFAHRAASRLNSEPMQTFSIGFGVLTAGIALSGTLSILLQLDATEWFLIQGVFVLFGLGLLLHSLYVGLPRTSA